MIELPASPHEILGVERSASQEDIRAAHKALRFRYHPDKNLDNVRWANSKFSEINQAYEILSDPIVARIYARQFPQTAQTATKSRGKNETTKGKKEPNKTESNKTSDARKPPRKNPPPPPPKPVALKAIARLDKTISTLHDISKLLKCGWGQNHTWQPVRDAWRQMDDLTRKFVRMRLKAKQSHDKNPLSHPADARCLDELDSVLEKGLKRLGEELTGFTGTWHSAGTWLKDEQQRFFRAVERFVLAVKGTEFESDISAQCRVERR